MRLAVTAKSPRGHISSDDDCYRGSIYFWTTWGNVLALLTRGLYGAETCVNGEAIGSAGVLGLVSLV